MKKLGISIYPEIVGEEKTIEYIKSAYKNGFTRIFANLLELKNDANGLKSLEMRKRVYLLATKKLNMELILDVNPSVYREFNLKNTELQFFKDLGATGIRLDEDFKGIVESKLSNNNLNMMIELNASASTSTFDKTLELGGNPKQLIACHNFYPMRWTGLDLNRFIKLSSYYQAKNIRVAAFITLKESQKGIGPWNVNEGMPTIEEHRDLSLLKQLEQMYEFDVIDDIIISQQGATEIQFKEIHNFIKKIEGIKNDKCINMHLNLEGVISNVEKDIINYSKSINWEKELINKHFNRMDITSYFVRSTLSRIIYKNADIPPKNSGKQLKRGDVVILNNNIGRYKGELHIIKRNMNDLNNSRNLIGKISPDDSFLISAIGPGVKFSLIIELIT